VVGHMLKACRLFCIGLLLAGADVAGTPFPAIAAEGTTAAGPIGGTDIRSALLPPPGVYGGLIGLYSSAGQVNDGSGNPAAGLDAVSLNAAVAGGILAYVPDYKILGGSIAFIGFLTGGQECGQVVAAIASRCISGFGDPYFEVDWSRSFGTVRPSRDPGAFPIVEGLTLDFGLGAVIPAGKYDATIQAMNGVTIGNKTSDIAPSVAFTYTTPPLIAEGTGTVEIPEGQPAAPLLIVQLRSYPGIITDARNLFHGCGCA